jgi:hypothetical protein
VTSERYDLFGACLVGILAGLGAGDEMAALVRGVLAVSAGTSSTEDCFQPQTTGEERG